MEIGLNTMNLTNLAKRITACSVLTAILAVSGVLSAGAQSQSPQPPRNVIKQFGPRLNQIPNRPAAQAPKQKVVSEHGDWKIACEDGAAKAEEDANDGKEACGMIQTSKHPERKNIALTLVLVKNQQADKTVTMMRLMAPIGVFLPTGIALEIDGEAVGRVPFTRCLPQVCVAFAEASPPTLEKMKKGAKAKFIIYEAPGLGLGMEFSLKGFTAGLTALHAR